MIEDKIKKLQSKIAIVKDRLETEESTKTALVLPFIQLLGYDIFNPTQVLPEFNCDIAKGKGEKVDYALLIKNKVEIIIECKGFGVNLAPHRNQLSRYFVSTKAKYAILTNGILYQFYTDLDNKNLMDEIPFFQFSLENYSVSDIEILEQFMFSNFNADKIDQNASEYKIITGVTGEIKTLFEKPNIETIKLFTKSSYKGRYTDSAISRLTILFKKALKQFVNDRVSNQLKSATEAEEVIDNNCGKIITTEEEKQAFYIVQAIARDIIPSEDIVMRDQINLCMILYKNDQCKPIVKLYFNDVKNLQIELFDEEGSYKIELATLDEIYDYKDAIIKICKKYSESSSVKRSAPFKFKMVNISVGETVVFEPKNLICSVVNDNTISYNGVKYSLSGFCAEYMPDSMKNASRAYQGPKYFSYKGKSLVDLRNEAKLKSSNDL